MIRDHSDHGTSNELMNPCPEWIHHLMQQDSSDLGQLILIQIIPVECTPSVIYEKMK